MAIPGNKSVVVTSGSPLLLGASQMIDGYNFAVEQMRTPRSFCFFTERMERSHFTSFFWMRNTGQDVFFLSL